MMLRIGIVAFIAGVLLVACSQKNDSSSTANSSKDSVKKELKLLWTCPMHPQIKKDGHGKCPICGNNLTIGVEYRIDSIAKEKEGYKPENAKIFYKLLPLHELIALRLSVPLTSQKTWRVYNDLIGKFGDEFNILLRILKDTMIKNKVDDKLIELILLSREGDLKVKPGFDGEYGKVLMPEQQKKLF